MNSKIVTNVAIALALAGVTATSHAGVKGFAVRPNNFSAGPAAVFVPLNAAGATVLNFNLPNGGRKVLTYSAECAVAAPAGSSGAWLDLDILVNGVAVAPTVGTLDAFCSSNGTAGTDGWTRASITVAFSGVVGANTVRIIARGNAGATGIWLGDSSLVVHD